MQVRRVAQLGRLSLGLGAFLATPIDAAAAHAGVAERLARRDELFLDSARRLVYDAPRSPYRPLLAAGGCEYGDLERSVRDRGLDPALAELRDAGVYVTLDEWKGREPIARNGVELHVHPADFENPLARGELSASSSGSTGAATRMPFGWAAVTRNARVTRVVLDAFGFGDADCGAWMPAPPGGSGLFVTLTMAKLGHPPQRWFTQTPPPRSPGDRLTLLFVVASSRLLRHPIPWPRHAELGDADEVARWLGAGDRPRWLHTFSSSAVRVADSAREQGIDLSGRGFLIGGEPVTPARKDAIRAAGATPMPIYISTDTGLVATGCPENGDAEDYHVHLDRIAAIPADRTTDTGPVPLLLSSLELGAGKVLLNVDVGDEAVLDRRPCGCLLGRLGLDLHLSDVRSRGKQTSEGMTVPARELWELTGEELAPTGATGDDYQIWEIRNRGVLNRVAIAVDPHLEVDETMLVERVLERLAARDAGGAVAASVWRQAGTLHVVRERPRLSAGGKLLPILAFEE